MARYILGLLFFGTFLCGGLYAGFLVAKQLPLAIEAKDWPTVAGTITESSLRRRQSRRTRHDLAYSYQVAGRQFTGHRITFMDRLFYGSAEDHAQKYRDGDAISVFYNPRDPAIAVLDTGVWWWGFVASGIAAVLFTLLGLFGIRASFRSPS